MLNYYTRKLYHPNILSILRYEFNDSWYISKGQKEWKYSNKYFDKVQGIVCNDFKVWKWKNEIPCLPGRECTHGSMLSAVQLKQNRHGVGVCQGYNLNANVNGRFARVEACNNVHGWQKSIVAVSVAHSRSKTENNGIWD